MLYSFRQFIHTENLFSVHDKILLAVSGGIDSVVMAELFFRSGLLFGIAHCNFGLRKEAGEEEKFVKQLAEKYKIPFHTVLFETLLFAKQQKLSVQMAARTLRYEWFEKTRAQYGYSFIATAHHKNDCIETVLLNFTRGTGISGLHGILPKNGCIIRPLLFATRTEIELFAANNNLTFKQDGSNNSDKYLRNKIRNKIIPVLKEINPSLENTLSENMKKMRDVELIYRQHIEHLQVGLFIRENNYLMLPVDEIKKLNPASTLLYELLHPFHFTISTVNSLLVVLNNAVCGKAFYSSTHRLVADRKFIIIQEKTLSGKVSVQIDAEQNEIKTGNLHLKTSHLKIQAGTWKPETENYIVNLDADKLQFPLLIRNRQNGDYFFPLGMSKKKKLSDFLIDNKIALPEKENIMVLTSEGQIIWVIGYRIDNRFKITKDTRNIYRIEIFGF